MLYKYIKTSYWGVDNNKALILMLYLLGFLFLSVFYEHYIVPKWSYYGFPWNPSVQRITLASLGLAVLVILVPARPKLPSDFFLHIHLLFPVLPMLVVYGLGNTNGVYTAFVVISFLVLIYARLVPVALPKIRGYSPAKIMRGCLLFTWFCIIAIFAFGGYKYINFDLFEVYDYRRQAASNLPSFFGYITPIVGKVLIPLALGVALMQRRLLASTAAIAGAIMIFALTSRKGPLFYPLVVFAIFYMAGKRKMIIYLLLGNIFIILMSFGELMWDSDLLANLIIRRNYFIPAIANYGYYDFFSSHPFVMLSNSKITFGLLEYPYELPAALMLGKVYWNNPEMSANTGWMGTSYMHFGFAGMLVFAVVIGILLRLIDQLSKKTPPSQVLALSIVPFLALFTSADLPTALLTHGLLVCMILIWLYNPSRVKKGVTK